MNGLEKLITSETNLTCAMHAHTTQSYNNYSDGQWKDIHYFEHFTTHKISGKKKEKEEERKITADITSSTATKEEMEGG